VKIKNIAGFRICMLGASIFSCGFALPITLPVWIIGEWINVRSKENA